MLLVSYDFESDKTRAKFARFLEKYGRRLQYSVFEVHHSERVLQNILTEVETKYKTLFTGADSIVIIPITPADTGKVIRYGFAKNEETDVLIFQ
jgi:CRISPR-associated protein Cas2